MNVNVYIIEDYKNEPPSGPKKQTQFKACPERSEFTLSVIEGNGPISSKAKMNLELIRKSGHTHLLDVLSFFRRTWSKKLLK